MDLIFYTIFGFAILETLFEIYVSLRQVYRTTLKVPIELEDHMSLEVFERAKAYGIHQELLSVSKTIINGFLMCVDFHLQSTPTFWMKSMKIVEFLYLNPNNEVLVTCVFLALGGLIGFVNSIIFELYNVFVLEEKYGFNRQTFKFFMQDQLKNFLITEAIMLPIAASFVLIVHKGGSKFFIWLWLFTALVNLLLLTLYPTLIAPLSDNYHTLEQGPLRAAIENLASSVNFPLTDLYVVEGSKRSAHSNAYFYGFGNSQRIVLFDTLLLNKGKPDDSELEEEEKGRGCTINEVLAVLAHEIGHWKLWHVPKIIVITQMHLLLMFGTFNYLFQYGPLYEAFGFKPGVRPVLFGLLLVVEYVMAPFNACLEYALTMLSRHFEYEADAFAHSLGFSKQLASSLIKLHIDNLDFPVYDWLYSNWNHSHPTLLQRLERLKQLDETAKKTN